MRITFDITNDILRAGYIASMENPLIERYMGHISFEEYKEKLETFDVWGIINDKPAGVILFDGNCIHIAILQEYFGKCGFVIRRALNLALKKYGSLIGLVDKDDKKAADFNLRLGFKKIGMTNDFIFYHRS